MSNLATEKETPLKRDRLQSLPNHSYSFTRMDKRSEGEWHLRWVWKDSTYGKESDWFGFQTLEECIDDFLLSLDTKSSGR